jgi:PIN domain nuclease of toxin-antitoxin system
LCISPVNLLEVQLLLEAGRVRLRRGESLSALEGDERWRLDDPPAAAWFAEARAISWTRDPFDRLLVAHAALRRFRLATGDSRILERLAPERVLVL